MRSRLVLVAAAGLAALLPLPAPGQSGGVRGVVYDSVGQRPLARASVQLVDVARPSMGRSATTDSSGAFAFGEVAPGRYLLGFLHEAVDSLGLDPPRVQLEQREGEQREVQLGIPAPAVLVGRLCSVDVARDSTGLLVGRLRSSDGTAATGGEVVVQWIELRFTRQGLQRATASQRGKTADDGMFAICGVPIVTPVVVRAWSGRDSTGLLELNLPSSGLMRRDLVVGPAITNVRAQTNDRVVMREGITPTMRRDTTAILRTSRGAGRVRGTIRLVSGAPLSDVHVSIWGTGLETTTSSDGAFVLDSVPEGSQTLVARAVGLVPWRGVVDVMSTETGVHDVMLAPFIPTLDTLRVRVAGGPPDSWRGDFDRRRLRGFGEFLDEKQIEVANPLTVSDLFREMAGVEIVTTGAFGRRVLMRGRAAGMFCIPAVYVDGLRFFTGATRPGTPPNEALAYAGAADLEYVVNPRDVKAVEVYPHDSSVPAEFDDPNDGCGSIVIWTGARKR